MRRLKSHSNRPFKAGIMRRYSASPSMWNTDAEATWGTVRSTDIWANGNAASADQGVSVRWCSLSTKQILHSSNKREMSEISTHKRTLQDQTSSKLVAGRVFSIFCEERKHCISMWLSVCCPVWIKWCGHKSPMYPPFYINFFHSVSFWVFLGTSTYHDVVITQFGHYSVPTDQ